jgi:hypothetical protein
LVVDHNPQPVTSQHGDDTSQAVQRRRPAQVAVPVSLVAMVGLAWTVLLVLPEGNGPQDIVTGLLMGALFGTLFALTALGAAWTVLGPWPLLLRVPLAIMMQLVGLVAMTKNVSMPGPGIDPEFLGVLGGAMLGQWVLTQAVLWTVAVFRGLRLQIAMQSARNDMQFGIRQVMILTAVIAVTLGAGRLVIQYLRWSDNVGPFDWEVVLLFGFLVLANTLITVPLIFSVALPRKAVLATGVALAFAVLTTACEIPAFELVRPAGSAGDDWPVFVIMNLAQTLWIAAALSILRFGGYRLISGRRGADA